MPSENDLTFTIGNQLLELVYVQGTDAYGFEMGGESWTESSLPIHTVRLSDFCLGKYPVTQGLWEAVMRASAIRSNPSYFQGDTNRPVEQVSWNDIMVSEGEKICFMDTLNALIVSNPANQEKLKKLAQAMGKKSIKFTLPSEAQWEYAARGGQNNMGAEGKWLKEYEYSGSNELHEVAWYGDNSHRETKPVGLKKPNDLGLYDMSGNVWERCLDYFDSKYYEKSSKLAAPPLDPVCENGSYRVVRGGSWSYSADDARLTNRNLSTPTYQASNIGFRICLA